MCTVSFIPGRDEFFLCSSRDEHIQREKAHYPRQYPSGDGALIYPMDPSGGGTWIVLKQNGDAIVLLNGAFQKHERRPAYKKSRGVILLELIATPDPLFSFRETDLQGIEPFTLIVFTGGSVNELRWDGSEKYFQPIGLQRAQIWSSATLYNEEARARREQWFRDWLEQYPLPEAPDLLRFHEYGGQADRENGLIINRNSGIITQSISLLRIGKDRADFHYLDLLTRKSHATGFTHLLSK